MRRATQRVFHETPPQVSTDKERSWITRGGNFAVCYSEVKAGAVLERADNPQEYMTILPPGASAATFEAGGQRIEAAADSLTIVPPGHSRITATADGVIVRIISKASGDIMDRGYLKCIDTKCYAGGWLTALEVQTGQLWQANEQGELRTGQAKL